MNIHRTIKSRQQRHDPKSVKMRVACIVAAVLWLAVMTAGAEAGTECEIPNRCCPGRFTVPTPGDKQFIFQQSTWADSCDTVTPTDAQGPFGIDTSGNTEVCTGETYLMSDPNWMVPVIPTVPPQFVENVASAFSLPSVEGCRWELWLVKCFDPIVCGDRCCCDCEDHVHFEEVAGQAVISQKKYCDDCDEWCDNTMGPDNVLQHPHFVTDANRGVLTTFRSDNNNGNGVGGLVFASAVRVVSPVPNKRSVHQPQLPSAWPPNSWLRAYCWKLNILCKYRKCKNYPCECHTNIRRRITCDLYAIFTDATGRTALQNLKSPVNVTRWAARHAVTNIRRFGRPVPTYTQLQQNTTTPTPTCTTYPSTHPTPRTTAYPPTTPTTSRPTVHSTRFPPRHPKPRTTVYRPRHPTTHRPWFPTKRTTVHPVLRYRTRG